MKRLVKKLFPRKYLDSIYDLPLEELVGKNIKGLLFDIDNTLAPYDLAEPDASIVRLLRRAQEMGFAVGLLSNAREMRVARFNSVLKVHAVHKAGKPGTRALKRAMAEMGTTKKTTAIVGDQVFTDVFCGNRAGIYTILVAPMSDRDEWITKIKRGLEKKVIRLYKKEGGKV